MEYIEKYFKLETEDEKLKYLSTLDFNQKHMILAYEASETSTCLRRKVGACLTLIQKNPTEIISFTGSNGAPKHLGICKTCKRQDLNIPSGQRQELCYAIHAEQAVIGDAAQTDGIITKNGILYVTTYPCSMCAKLIISSGIKTVYYHEGYPDELAKEILSDIEVVQI